MRNLLTINNLWVSVHKQPIIKGVTLTIYPGEVHALMGPNGSGKSTLAQALAGHPRYEVTKGSFRLNGSELAKLSPEKRAQQGLFLAFQNPSEVAGVKLFNLLWQAHQAIRKEPISAVEFLSLLDSKLALLGIDQAFLDRVANEGFSGGEKKKAEILQLLTLSPKLAILDEIDSGLDVDALKLVAQAVNSLVKEGTSILVITHYQRILEHIKPSHVHVLKEGKIVASGGGELVKRLEKEGYGLLGN